MLKSHWRDVLRGVPHGSILGPLFTEYLVHHISHCNYHMYLPSAPAVISVTADTINQDLQHISNWASTNCLLINPNKISYSLLFFMTDFFPFFCLAVVRCSFKILYSFLSLVICKFIWYTYFSAFERLKSFGTLLYWFWNKINFYWMLVYFENTETTWIGISTKFP